MIGYNDIGFTPLNVFSSFHLERPQGIHPHITVPPETGEMVQYYKPFIEWQGCYPYNKSNLYHDNMGQYKPKPVQDRKNNKTQSF
jgi:hypothetical protein